MIKSAFLVTLFAATAALASTTTLSIDTKMSAVSWTGSKVVGDSHNGDVKLSAGQVQLNGENIVGGEFTIDMNTINNIDLAQDAKGKAKLEGHLKSDDFFGVAKHPTATFKILEVKATPAKKAAHTHDITGELTIKGKTNKITVPATIKIEKGMATAKATFEIDRTLWDVRYASKNFFENLAGDRIINNNIKFDLNLVAQTPTKKEAKK